MGCVCDVCGMQYVGQTNNIRLRMNGHKSYYQKFINGAFSKSDTSSLYSHLKSHDVKIFKFQILEILENEGFKYTKDIRQLEASLDAKERHWIWKLETDTARIKLNVFMVKIVVAERTDLYFSLQFNCYIYIYIYMPIFLRMYMCACVYMKLPSILPF